MAKAAGWRRRQFGRRVSRGRFGRRRGQRRRRGNRRRRGSNGYGGGNRQHRDGSGNWQHRDRKHRDRNFHRQRRREPRHRHRSRAVQHRCARWYDQQYRYQQCFHPSHSGHRSDHEFRCSRHQHVGYGDLDRVRSRRNDDGHRKKPGRGERQSHRWNGNAGSINARRRRNSRRRSQDRREDQEHLPRMLKQGASVARRNFRRRFSRR